MSPGDILSGAVWFVLIGGAAVLISRSSANDKIASERRKSERADAEARLRLEEAQESTFVDEAISMLPDAERALAHLKHRYGWLEILECHDIGALQLRLLAQTIDGDEVELPNLALARIDAASRRVLQQAQSLAPEPGWPEDVQASVQEPTVQTLLDLQANGLVIAKPLGSEPTTRYRVRFTEAGRRLEHMNGLFRDKGRHPSWPKSRPDLKLYRKVERVVRAALRPQPKNAA